MKKSKIWFIFGIGLYYFIFGILMVLLEFGKDSELSYILFLTAFFVLPSGIMVKFTLNEVEYLKHLEAKVKENEKKE